MKKCTKCGIEKKLSEFYKQKRGKYGLRPYCKVCINKQIKEYYKTKKGLITRIYGNQRYSSKKRGHLTPSYTNKELQDWIFKQDNFEELFNNWVKSNYNKMLVPSCDRLDDYKGYSLDNIQLITWSENDNKGHSDIRNGINTKNSKAVIGINKITGEKVEFYSIKEASRKTNITWTYISTCCNGRIKTAGGYAWKFKN